MNNLYIHILTAFSAIVLLFLASGCNQPPAPAGENTLTAEKTTVSDTTVHPVKAIPAATECNCSPVASFDTDKGPVAQFSQRDIEHPEDFRKKWEQYTHDSIRTRIRTLLLNGISEIPDSFRIFSGIEKLVYTGSGMSRRNPQLKGADIFPKLHILEIWGGGRLDTTAAYMQRIDVLLMGKSALEGLRSFKHMPNLKVIRMHHSGFNLFPADINSLACLQEITLAEYRFGRINLEQIDLKKLACLRKAHFSGETDNVPQGLADSSRAKIDLYLRNPYLSKENKALLADYKKRK